MATYKQKKESCEKRMIEFNFTEQEWKKFNEMNRTVTCAYTNVPFVHEVNHHHQPTCERLSEDLGDRRLWVKDKALPVTNDNVIVCVKDLAQALDTLVVSANINFKQLQKIAKVLSK